MSSDKGKVKDERWRKRKPKKKVLPTVQTQKHKSPTIVGERYHKGEEPEDCSECHFRFSLMTNPESGEGSGNPVATKWFKSTFVFDNVCGAIDTRGNSNLSYPVLTLQNLYVSLESHIAIVFDEFQVRDVVVRIGEISEHFSRAPTGQPTDSSIHCCVDLDTTLVSPVQMLDNRANSRIYSIPEAAKKRFPLARFTPTVMLDNAGSANQVAVSMDKTWTSCTTGKNVEWQGFLYYLSWNKADKPNKPATPPQFKFFVTAELRFRGMI